MKKTPRAEIIMTVAQREAMLASDGRAVCYGEAVAWLHRAGIHMVVHRTPEQIEQGSES